MSFPEAVFFEWLWNPDELDCTGRHLSWWKLHEESRLKFDAAFARRLCQGGCAEYGSDSQGPEPAKCIHGRIIGRCAPAHYLRLILPIKGRLLFAAFSVPRENSPLTVVAWELSKTLADRPSSSAGKSQCTAVPVCNLSEEYSVQVLRLFHKLRSRNEAVKRRCHALFFADGYIPLFPVVDGWYRVP